MTSRTVGTLAFIARVGDREAVEPVAHLVFRVRWTKFDKTRQLPLGPTTVSARAGRADRMNALELRDV